MSLERFLSAQAADQGGHATALGELKAGHKTSHWIWYVFPQLAALGRSPTAKFYGLNDFAEAQDYLREPTLRKNLLTLLKVVREQLESGVSLIDLMGGETDTQKLVSCATLFERGATALNQRDPQEDLSMIAQSCADIIGAAEQQGYTRCKVTLEASD